MKNILPDVHLGPVADGKYTEVFAHPFLSVENVPEFRSLVLGVPLAKFIPVRKEPFLCAGFFFVTPAPANGCIKFVLLDGIQKGYRLKYIPAGIVALFLDDPSRVDRFLDRTHDQPGMEFFHERITELQGFFKIMAGIDVDEWKKNPGWPKGLLCKVYQHDRILTPGK